MNCGVWFGAPGVPFEPFGEGVWFDAESVCYPSYAEVAGCHDGGDFGADTGDDLVFGFDC
jgi:hypothetical protein